MHICDAVLVEAQDGGLRVGAGLFEVSFFDRADPVFALLDVGGFDRQLVVGDLEVPVQQRDPERSRFPCLGSTRRISSRQAASLSPTGCASPMSSRWPHSRDVNTAD
jgi:hypothetical protein